MWVSRLNEHGKAYKYKISEHLGSENVSKIYLKYQKTDGLRQQHWRLEDSRKTSSNFWRKMMSNLECYIDRQMITWICC